MNVPASSGQLRAGFIRWALFLVPGILLLGLLSGQLAGSGPDNPWFAALEKPEAYPPPATFGIVWTILYVLMGLALAMVIAARGAPRRGVAIAAFLIQLVLNLVWTPLFFAAHQITAALILIGALDFAVLVTIVQFWKVRPLAGALLLPYILWILFASYLNWELRAANPHLDGQNISGAVQRIEL